MIMLRPPFEGGNPLVVARKIVEGSYPPLEGSCSPLLGEVVTRLLCTDPEQRPDIEQVALSTLQAGYFEQKHCAPKIPPPQTPLTPCTSASPLSVPSPCCSVPVSLLLSTMPLSLPPSSVPGCSYAHIASPSTSPHVAFRSCDVDPISAPVTNSMIYI